jgi:hypothetical protein
MVGMTTPVLDALAAQVLLPALPVLPVLHLGDLHAYEKALVLLVAFGPFVVLAVVVHVVRRRDIAEEEREGVDLRPGRSHPR